MITANILNLPATLNKHLTKNNGVVWITATPVDGELWFYGLWYTEAEAQTQARNEGKIVLKMEA